MPKRVYADPARVRQVLTNLVSNALKFTEAGSVTVRLSCFHALDGTAEIHLAVTDTGPGISRENIPLLGEKFRQLDSTYTRRHGGTGLGLAITRSLLMLMDGELQITSDVGQGSTFTAIMRLRLST
jgi:signal transduction histidine kinase